MWYNVCNETLTSIANYDRIEEIIEVNKWIGSK